MAGREGFRRDADGGRFAVERIRLARTVGLEDRADLVFDLDLHEVVRGRAGEGIPRQREVREGIDALRGEPVRDVWRGGIGVAGQVQGRRAIAAIRRGDEERVGAAVVNGVQRAFRGVAAFDAERFAATATAITFAACWRSQPRLFDFHHVVGAAR